LVLTEQKLIRQKIMSELRMHLLSFCTFYNDDVSRLFCMFVCVCVWTLQPADGDRYAARS